MTIARRRVLALAAAFAAVSRIPLAKGAARPSPPLRPFVPFPPRGPERVVAGPPRLALPARAPCRTVSTRRLERCGREAPRAGLVGILEATGVDREPPRCRSEHRHRKRRTCRTRRVHGADHTGRDRRKPFPLLLREV